MFRYLNLAFIRQKRWALLFLLTIFLPSAILSIFGLIGLRNERFRLQQLVRSPSFSNRDYPEMLNLVQNHLENQSLAGQFMVLFEGAPPWFPPFRGEGSGYKSDPVAVFSPVNKRSLK